MTPKLYRVLKMLTGPHAATIIKMLELKKKGLTEVPVVAYEK